MTGYSHMRERIVPQFMRVLHENGPTHISKISARTAEILGLTPQEAALRYQVMNTSSNGAWRARFRIVSEYSTSAGTSSFFKWDTSNIRKKSKCSSVIEILMFDRFSVIII